MDSEAQKRNITATPEMTRAEQGNKPSERHGMLRSINIPGWITTPAIFSATIGLVITWFI